MYSKKLIILENQNLTKYLIERLDFKNSYNGFYIECWNILPIINYNIFRKYKPKNIKSKNKFINVLSFAHLYKLLSNYKERKFFYFNNCGTNFWSTVIDIILYFKGGKKILIRPTEHDLKIDYSNRLKEIFNFNILYFLKRTIFFFSNTLKKNMIKFVTPKASIIFAGNNFLFRKLKKSGASVFKFNCPEFEKFFYTKIKKDKKYLVYIDQDMFQSFDNSINHSQEQILNPKKYEKELFNTIGCIENSKFFKEYPLMIAAHPRRKKKFNFRKQKVFFNKTFELISKAKVVLAHTSLAIKYAILFEKPIILLNAKKYFNSENLAEINFLKNNLNLITIDISDTDTTNLNKIKKIFYNKKKYKKFKEEFISFPHYKKMARWKEVANRLEKFN